MVVALLAQEVELVTEAVSDGGLADFNGKCRTPVLSSQDTDYIHVIEPVPRSVKIFPV